MKTLLTLLFTLSVLFSMAQKQAGWEPILDSMGTEFVQGDKYLILIDQETATFNIGMQAEIDSWLTSMNTASKKDRGVIVYKLAFADHKPVYGKDKEVARKNSFKGTWVVAK